MDPIRKSYLQLHIAVLLFGFTAILGDLINLSAYWLVWWRVLLASLSLLFIVGWSKILRSSSRKLILKYFAIGSIVAAHWVSFYGAVKLSNASLGVVCIATSSFMTALLEPILLRKRLRWVELLLGLLIVPGMILIVKGSPMEYGWGIVVGLISAFLASLFGVLNKSLILTNDPLTISFFELTGALIVLTLLSPLIFHFMDVTTIFPPQWADWMYLAILAFLCTTLAYSLSLASLRHLSAFATSLTINLEPIYGIILAWILLNDGDELQQDFYWGSFVIVFSVFLYPLIENLKKKRT